MRVLLLSQFFDPEPTLKGLAFAKALREQGHDVQVLTGFPNYPGGKIYPGYRLAPYRKEVVDGVTIHRVALYPSHDRSSIRRVLNYASFGMMASVVGPLVTGKVDAMVVHHPPLTVDWPARVLRFLKGAPYLYEIQDLWPDTLGSTGMLSRPGLLRLIDGWSRRVYKSADGVIAISEGFKTKLVERGVPADKVAVLHNWAEEGRLRFSSASPEEAKRLRSELGLGERFTVMFAGNMGLAQALDPVLDAAKRLPEVQFAMVGSGVERDRLVARAEAEGIANIVFVPRQPMERMGAILPLADALLIHLQDDPLFSITIPGKTQAYLSAGIPTIVAVRGDAAELVQASGGGVSAIPEDVGSIVDAIEAIRSMSSEERSEMGARGRSFYERELSMAAGVPVVDGLLRSLPRRKGFYARFGKRAFDVAASAFLIVTLGPAMLALALLVRTRLGSPVIFRQRRPGLRGRSFAMTKFRSMTDAVGPDGHPLPDDQRVTALGAKLRSASLDELPELFNVLRGEMSLVGPRPLLERYTEWYSPEERRRLEVRPGITGLAQVEGRNDLHWDARLAHDVRYVESMSFLGDLRILIRTVQKVVKRDGVRVVPGSTMLDLDVERRARLAA